MKRNKKLYSILTIVFAVLIIVLQILMVQLFPNNQGTDDQSVEAIQELAPQYTPWVTNLWSPDNAEQIIFSIQAILGLSIIVFYFIKQQKLVKTPAK